MKKVIFILSLVFILAFTSVTAFAQTANEITVAIDSVKVEFTEDSGFPFIDENSRTLVPFKKALETYGATVEWNNDSRVATAVKNDIKVEVPIGQNYIIVNGEQKAIDTAARIVNDRTFLPIKAVIEAFGSEVVWDQNLRTVVITTIPVDAKAIFTQANSKSADWKNYDADIIMNMSLPVKDDAGSIQTMTMNMKMFMTIFTDPSIKAKINSSVVMNMMGQEVVQPVMDMYLTADDKSLTTYMGMNDGTGSLTWTKSAVEDEMFGELFKHNKETIKANQELTEKYTKDVKYFGKYKDEAGKTLLRMQYTMSGEIYNDMFGEYIKNIESSTDEQEAMTAEILKGFANGNFGDLTYIIYIDEATGEIVKYEMDLSSIVNSMMEGMTAMLGEIPAEEMEMLKQMKATMVMEVLNVNQAKDFEIPEEALNAPEMSELIEQTQDTTTESTETGIQ